MRIHKSFVFFIVGFMSTQCWAQDLSWPSLPKQGFISGRSATKNDVASGNAAFVAAIGNAPIGKPLKIAIPQYAYFKDAGKKVPVIVIQAEEAQGKKLLGARDLSGHDMVGFISDF